MVDNHRILELRAKLKAGNLTFAESIELQGYFETTPGLQEIVERKRTPEEMAEQMKIWLEMDGDRIREKVKKLIGF